MPNANREDRVACRTPNPDKPGVTNIPKWKFDTLRAAILAELKRGDISFVDLRKAVGESLSDKDRCNMGSVGWHVTSVKLELEVRGEIARVPGKSPQILTLNTKG